MDTDLRFDLNDVQFFLAIARAGSLAAAARNLEVAQPTVGRRIRHMESSLGVRLFDRTPQGHVLTRAGEKVLRAAERIEESASTIARQVGGDEHQLAGTVRITTTEGFANAWLVQLLPSVQARYPHINLEILVSTQLTDILRLEADIALRIGTPGSEELVGRRVGQIGFGLYASADYLEDFASPVTVESLADHAIIESAGALENVEQARVLRELAPNARVVLRTDSIMTQLQAAKDGLGLAPLAHYVSATEPTLQRVLTDEFDVQRDLWLLTHRDLKFTARIRAVMELVTAAIKEDAAQFSGERSGSDA